jgi:L-lactate dehydrogenase complex protein LldG
VSGARATILGAVRRVSERTLDTAVVAAEAAALVAEPSRYRPAEGEGGVLERFLEKVTSPRLAGTHDRIDEIVDLPRAVSRYLEHRGLPPSVTLEPEPSLCALNWGDIEVHATIAADEAVSVGIARWGIAETGTLVFHSGPRSPGLFSFLPLHHVVALRREAIVSYMEDYLAAFSQAGEQLPRMINFITGTSGTTDIEATFARGAHGPRFLHVILIGER